MTQFWTIILMLAMVSVTTGWAAAPTSAESASPAAETTEEGKVKPAPPSFQPGAEVLLAVTLKAPRDWGLNYMVPIRLQFDVEYLKTAPFKVRQATWDSTIESYLPQFIVEIPIVLDTDLADEPFTIPLDVQCSVCESTGEQCTFCMETMTIKLQVKSEPGEDDGTDQALTKGTLEYSYRLSLP